MKSFHEWLHVLRVNQPCFAALKKMSWLQFHEREGKIFRTATGVKPSDEARAARPLSVTPEYWETFIGQVAKTITYSISEDKNHLDLWTMAGLCADGLKAFCPTVEECLALAKVDLNITWSDYRQPFDTFVVVLPDGFFASDVSHGVGRPLAVVVRHDQTARLCGTLTACTGGENFSGNYWWGANSAESVESFLSRQPSFNTTDAEESAHGQATRIALNACLMLTQFGARHLGYASPGIVRDLEASLKKKKLPDRVRNANLAALKLTPDIYAFDQSVRLCDYEGDHSSMGSGGCEVKTHWRRGHWAKVACGTNRSDRRLVFRRPTMVNAHKFYGEKFNTTATYTTKPQSEVA